MSRFSKQKMVVPNARNARLMATDRMRPYRRGGGNPISGPTLVDAFNQSYTGSTSTTHVLTVDLTAFSAGDRVLVGYGIEQQTSALTVNIGGSTATVTKVTLDSGGTGGRLGAFTFTMPVNGTAADTFTFTLGAEAGNMAMHVAGFRNGDFADVTNRYLNTGAAGPLVLIVTPLVEADNIIYTLAMGLDANGFWAFSVGSQTDVGDLAGNSIAFASYGTLTGGSTGGVSQLISKEQPTLRIGALAIVVE